jgi:hypothetical protein
LICAGEGDGYLRPPERGRDRWFNVQEDIHCLVGFLEVAVVLIGLFLALLVVRRPWVWGIFECSPKFVALLSGAIALQMPQALLFQQAFEVA